MIIALSGVLSAFLVNDVVCVAMTPLVLGICQRLERPPIPYLVGLATAANIGSVATITGNPQNMIIGSLSHDSLPAVRRPSGADRRDRPGRGLRRRGAGLSQNAVRGDARNAVAGPRTPHGLASIAALLVKSVTVTLITVGLFFAGQPIALVALAAAGISDARPACDPRRFTSRSTGRCWSCSPGCSSWSTPSKCTCRP